MFDTVLPEASALAVQAPRIAAMRERVLQDKTERTKRGLGATGEYAMVFREIVDARALRASEDEPSWQRRRAYITGERMRSWTFLLDEHEQFVGRFVPREEYTQEEINAARAYVSQYPGIVGMNGHCELELSLVLAKGIDGLVADITAHQSKASSEQIDTYASFLDVLDGLSQMLEHMAEVAEAHKPHASPGRQAELVQMVAACRHVAHKPPVTVRQALQLFWAIWLGVSHADGAACIALGHIDRWMRPVFEADRRENGLTDAETLFLLENLYLLVNACWQDNSAIPVMVGGRNAAGEDVTNELSYLCLEALRRTGLCYPTVGVVWHENTPMPLVDLATDLVSRGYSTPAFFGEDVIRDGLLDYQTSADDAANFINSACVEITPSGASNVWVATPYFSTCKHLVEEIGAQLAAAQPSATFDAFLSAYLARMQLVIAEAVMQINNTRRVRREHGRFPLQSVFTRDCITRGCDLDDGGALYNWAECSFVGLANLVDSLYVIEQEVFVEKTMTLAELMAVLQDDFDGEESTRQRFLNAHAKYGNDDSAVDGLLGRILLHFQAECAKHTVEPDGSPFIPGAFCWIMHQRLGAECGATPDGRRAGRPFADGCGPAQGREMRGPTAAILSTTSWNHRPMIGGLAFNMKFNSSLFDSPESVQRLRDLIVTYLRRGGFETQINVVDHAVLKKAREHPEDYRDLVVRIGGYTDYFTRLSPEMQDEVMLRTEYTRI